MVTTNCFQQFLVALVLIACSAQGYNGDIPIGRFNPTCSPIDEGSILKEIKDYEHNHRFKRKIAEVRGEVAPDERQPAIVKFLRHRKVLEKDMAVLDLGCAAGSPLRLVSQALNTLGGYGNLTGIELVPGWVDAGNAALAGIATLIRGDATNFDLGSPAPQYDLVMLNDVLEHVMPARYACLFESMARHAQRRGAYLYFHIPTPITQLTDTGQYFENVVPPHIIIEGLARYGFELVVYEPDMTVNSRGKRMLNSRHLPKYVHMLFQKAPDIRVFKGAQKENHA